MLSLELIKGLISRFPFVEDRIDCYHNHNKHGIIKFGLEAFQVFIYIYIGVIRGGRVHRL